MSDAIDFAKLRRILNGFTRTELDRLIHDVLRIELHVDEETSDDITSRRRTVDALIDALKCLEPLEELLTLMAKVHCFFVRSGADKLVPWSVHRVADTQKELPTESTADALMDADRLFDVVCKGFLMTTFRARCYWELRDGFVYACLLLQDLNALPLSEEHHPSYVVYAPGLPLLAVNASRTAVHNAVVASLGRALWPATVDALDISRTNLRSSFEFACRRIGVTVGDDIEDVPSLLRGRPYEEEDALKVDAAGPQVVDFHADRHAEVEEAARVIFGTNILPAMATYTVRASGGASVTLRGPNVLESLRKLHLLGHFEDMNHFFEPAFEGKESIVVTKKPRKR